MVLLTACFGVIGKTDKSVKYERIPDSKEGAEEEDKMMENTIGLEDGKCYKFRNRADNTVIELMLGSSNKMICGNELTAGENSHQIFEVFEEDSGQYRIACKFQSADAQHFWDYLPHRKQLIHKKKSTAESSLQLWTSERVPGLDTAFFIISIHNQFCLKSSGKSKQVVVSERNDEDPAQHWRLEVQPF